MVNLAQAVNYVIRCDRATISLLFTSIIDTVYQRDWKRKSRTIQSIAHAFPVLQDIALRTTTRSGISRGLAYCHLLEQLSVCLWRHNARTFLHLFSLLPGSPLWELNSVSCSHFHYVHYVQYHFSFYRNFA